MAENKLEIWTIGHSTRPIEELIEALTSFEIKVLADVRSFPGSRRYPHFNKEQLKAWLAAGGIEYQHFPELGGRRRVRPDSYNMACTAIMCAEAVWWRCHRSLISDYLKAKDVEVTHILAKSKSQAHPFTSAARIVNGELSYRGVLES